MAFIFTMRSAPVAGSMHRRDPASGSTLPAISEDRASFITPRDAPPVPPRAHNRPFHRQFGLDPPPTLAYECSPPAYNEFDVEGVEGPNGEKLNEMRHAIGNNKHIAKRGGWKRLIIIAIVVFLCIIGLVVGLVVGLTKKNQDSNSKSEVSSSTSGGASSSSEPGVSPSDSAFPSGSYSFATYLSTVATNCTSNPATWACYPFTTYAESRAQAMATFDWIISSNDGDHMISSTPNPFSLMFNNVSLSLLSEGNDDEHWYFEAPMSKPTKPTSPLSDSNDVATCYFNASILQGYLYTKTTKTYPSSPDNSPAGAYEPWPYAVKIEQVSSAGPNTPDCQDASGNSLGSFSVQDESQMCGCLYINTGT